jgi:ParB family chromosome partitioning protein
MSTEIVVPASLDAVAAREISLDQIKIGKTNPRRSFDDRALAELTNSVRLRGVLQPILVRPIADSENSYELVAGERRYRASKAAGKKTIPVTVRQLTDAEAMEIAVIENLQRQDVHPMDEALGYQALINKDAKTYTVEGISASVAKPPRYVAYRLNLLNLTDSVRKAFYDDKLSVAHAIEIGRLQPTEQEQALDKCFPNHRNRAAMLKDGKAEAECTVRQLQNWIHDHFHLDLSKAPFDTKDANLLSTAGACVTCPKRAGNNPLLFAEVARKETCTDGNCFQSKRDAFVQIKLTALESEGKKPVKVSSLYLYHGDKKRPDVLYNGDYRQSVKGGCEHTQTAVVIDGDKIGTTLHLCTEEKCSVHYGRTSFSTPEQKVQRSKEIKAQKVQKAYRLTLLNAVRAKLPTAINRVDLEMVANSTFDRIGHDNRRRVFAVYGWEEKKTKGIHSDYVDHKKIAATNIAAMSVSDIGKFLIVCSLASDLYISETSQLGNDSLLMQTAKRHKLNPNSIFAEAKAEIEKKKTTAKAKVTTTAKVAAKRK